MILPVINSQLYASYYKPEDLIADFKAQSGLLPLFVADRGSIDDGSGFTEEWKDQSGGGYDMDVQSTASKRPAIVRQARNNRQGNDFNADLLKRVGGLGADKAAVTIFIVAEMVSGGTRCWLDFYSAANNRTTIYSSSRNVRMLHRTASGGIHYNTNSSASYASGQFIYLTILMDQTSLQVRGNGAQIDTQNISGSGNVQLSKDMFIGDFGNGGAGYTANICFLAIYDSKLGSVDYEPLESALAKYYHIP